MNRLKLLPVLFLYLALSCQDKKAEVITNDDSFRTYKIEMDAQKTDFLDQVESIEILGLEETSVSLLKPTALYFTHQDGVVVIDEDAGDVTSFNKLGEFVSHFNKKGRGPKEYAYMSSSNFRDGFIETFVYEGEKLMQFDLSGNFIQKIDFPYPMDDALFFDDGYLLGMGFPIGMDSVKHNLIMTDAQLKPTSYALPLNKPGGIPVTPPNNDFQLFNDKALFNPFWTDSIYQIKDGVVKPYVHFDFGDDWLWKEFPLTRNLDGKTMDAMNKSGKIWGYTMVYGEDRIEIEYTYSFEQPPRQGYIDKASGTFYHYEHKWIESERIPLVPIRFKGKKLISLVTPDAIEELVSAVGNDNTNLLGSVSLEQISESENPVLVWVNFK
ncbi:6-bladed beta-propeller [Roseivirga misakiensis]|uniref:6-bladed beta-propeller n=1 Tax=Roseivirga misakiensis TaxID=1563681 RepID=A0A1E5T264_9BACT|nr:6-bladed beta-propeller [Roseivirga misakiensis]OEK05456.1 hypothetical protein BFP71_18915 [Roseivirga misakiensis]